MEGNLSPDVIRVAGRWSSECYQIYTRATLGGTARIAQVVGSTPFEDQERASARVGGVQPMCKVTFLRGGWQKEWPKSEEFSEKYLLTHPLGDKNGPKMGLHTHFLS